MSGRATIYIAPSANCATACLIALTYMDSTYADVYVNEYFEEKLPELAFIENYYRQLQKDVLARCFRLLFVGEGLCIA